MRPSRFLRLATFVLPISCAAHPEAQPEAHPKPVAEAEPQTYANNAPFSGAIYIVNPDGQGVTAQGTNMCPSHASLSCGDISQPSWCCPSGYTCAAPANANGIIGCCPAGSSCGGSVNVASVSTVTVYSTQQTSVAYVQPPAQATTVVGVYAQPTTTQVGAGDFCQTLTMQGPGLPTVTQGSCGAVLIVEGDSPSLKVATYSTGVILVLIHIAVGRMFHWT